MTICEIRAQLESLLTESRYMESQKDADGIYTEDRKALEETLDILHDYELQAEHIRKESEHFRTEGKPGFRNGVWLCPVCGKRVWENNTHCRWCGKMLGWKSCPENGGGRRCRR